MSRREKRRSSIHELFLPVAELIGMEFMPFANDGQGVLLFKDFKNDLELKVGGKFARGFAFQTGLE